MVKRNREGTGIIATRDRFTKGLLAGMAGGVAMAIPDIMFTAFGWVKFAYYDWGLSLIFGSTAGTLLEAVIGQTVHILFAGFLGVIFAYLVNLISSINYLIKGWLYGFFVWFLVHVVVNLANFGPLKPIPLSQLLSDFVTASIYGLVLAAALHRLSPEKVG